MSAISGAALGNHLKSRALGRWVSGAALCMSLAVAVAAAAEPAAPAAVSRAGSIAVTQTGEIEDAYAGQLAYSPDGRQWVTGEQREIGVYEGLKRVRQLENVWLESEASLAFSADGKRLLAGGRLYNFADGKELFAPNADAISQHTEQGWGIAAAALAPDERQCLAWLKFFPSRCCRERGHHDSPSFKPASPLFVISPKTGEARPLPMPEKHSWGEYGALAVSQQLLVVGGSAPAAVVFNRGTLARVATLDADGAWYGFRFSADGRTLVGIHLGNSLIVYDTRSFARRASFQVLPENQYVSAMAMHPKRPMVAVSGWDGNLRIISLVPGEEGRELYKSQLGQATALAFSPTGAELLAAVSGAPKSRIVRLSIK